MDFNFDDSESGYNRHFNSNDRKPDQDDRRPNIIKKDTVSYEYNHAQANQVAQEPTFPKNQEARESTLPKKSAQPSTPSETKPPSLPPREPTPHSENKTGDDPRKSTSQISHNKEKTPKSTPEYEPSPIEKTYSQRKRPSENEPTIPEKTHSQRKRPKSASELTNRFLPNFVPSKPTLPTTNDATCPDIRTSFLWMDHKINQRPM
jgi:hypothetical protein